MLAGTSWVKVTVVAWLPGNMVGAVGCVYYLSSDKDKTLLWAPLFKAGVAQFRAK